MTEKLYEEAFRLANPSSHHPMYYPRTQRRLSDLWPADQEKFKRMCDAVLKARGL